MNIDPSTPAREVLIRYLESSGVNQQKEAAAEMRKMESEIAFLRGQARRFADENLRLIDTNDRLSRNQKSSLTSRIALWFKKGK